jgi:hypothetical protein
MGMSGHMNAGLLRECVKVADCCDPFFIGTLTCVKSLEMVLRATLSLNARDLQWQIISFDLVGTIRVCVLIIKSPNQISLIAGLKVINLTAVRNHVKV